MEWQIRHDDQLELDRHQLDRRRRNQQRRQQRRRLDKSTTNVHGDDGDGCERLLTTLNESITTNTGVIAVTNACQDSIPATSVHVNDHTMEGKTPRSERQQTKQKQQQQDQQLHLSPHKRPGRKHQNPNTNHVPSRSSSSSLLLKNNTEPKISQEDVKSNPIIKRVNPNHRNRHRRTRNHRHRQSSGFNNSHAAIHDDIDCNCNNVCSISSSTTSSSIPDTRVTQTTANVTTTNHLDTSRNDDSLASRLKHLWEKEERQYEQQQQQKQRLRMGMGGGGGLHLTTLSTSSRPSLPPPPLSIKTNYYNQTSDDQEGEFSTQYHDTSPSSTVESLMIPNAKVKWTHTELSKMRHRWWKALRAERTKIMNDENKLRITSQQEAMSVGSSLSCSTSLENVQSIIGCRDAMEPPSLSAPFDEDYHSVIPSIISATISPQGMPNPIIDLERKCIESACPLHFAVYNHALCHGEVSDYCDNNHDAMPTKREKSDTELVLYRLLTMHDINEISRWKSMRAGLSDMRGLEANVVYSQTRADTLTDMTAHRLSADITSLTPLQLAVYWNLPDIIRLLCTTGVQQPTLRTSIEEDDKCRTPLMLACELGHVASIQSLMCASTFKVGRREREGGNSAFHFCCIGSSLLRNNRKPTEHDHDDYCGLYSRRQRDAFDMLLRYTPVKDQKNALLSTNRMGQNVFHVACSQGDVTLLERLMEMQILPGVNIAKALNSKDSLGYTPFLSAVAADSTDVAMHLLSSYFATASWFDGRPLLIAVRKKSTSMVKLLLETGHDKLYPYSFRMLAGDNMLNQEELQSALFEAIAVALIGKGSNSSENNYEMISLLISHGYANPHQVESTAHPTYDQVPLLVAVRAADVDCVRCMVTTYSKSQLDLNKLDRNDPILQRKPEAFFQERERVATEKIRLSIDAAIVTALFMLWKTAHIAYGEIVLFLFDRGYSNLSSTGNLSQRAIHWLHRCTLMRRLNMNCFFMPATAKYEIEGCYFEAKLKTYCISNTPGKKAPINVVQKDADTDCMDWSYVLSKLSWFSSRFHRVNCRWMRTILSKSSTEEKVANKNQLDEDEFYLVVGETKLLAHKSIVSARSGKLAAHIRFIESREEESSNGAKISLNVEIPLLAAMMLLSHCYHGSIAFGLKKSLAEQCNQLMEMALIAEEYICPSLLLECELRLVMPTSHLEKYDCNPCICSQCNGCLSSSEKSEVPYDSQNFNSSDVKSACCEYAGFYIYETRTFVKTTTDNTGLITPENCLDILAIAQQLEQSSCFQRNLYGLKYCYSSGTNNCLTSTSSCGDVSIDDGKVVHSDYCVLAPFAAAKLIAVWMMLRNFPAVVRSKAYLHQIDGGDEANDYDEVDATFVKRPDAENVTLAIPLLQTCLEELACSPYLYKH